MRKIKKINWHISLSLLLVLSFLFLFQWNTVISKSYELRNYHQTSQESLRKKERLMMDWNDVDELDNLNLLAKNSGFEKVEKTHYIVSFEESLVTK